MIALAVSLDAFFGSFAYGLDKKKITPLKAVYVGAWTLPLALTAVLLGGVLRRAVPFAWGQAIGGAGLIIAAGLSIREALRAKEAFAETVETSWLSGALLGISVGMDAGIAAFGVGIAGADPVQVTVLFTVLHVVMVYLGNRIAFIGALQLGSRARVLPGLILMALGLMRFR